MAEPKRGYLFRERPSGEGSWGSWKVAELGIPSLLRKAQDRPDEYEVEEIMPVAEHTQALATATVGGDDYGAESLSLAHSVLDGIGGFDDARPNERDTRALVAAATALVGIGEALQQGLAGIEDRLSDVRQGMS